MSSEEMTIEQARAKLGDRVIAAMNGQPTIITRYGRPAAMLVPYVKESTVITLYETNSDLLVMARGNDTWAMGAPGASPGYLEGTFAEDAQAWANGDWAPNEGDGQHSTTVDDDLTAVARWTADEGVRILVERERLGGAAETYLGDTAPPATYTAAVCLTSSVVAGDFCDVSVAENRIATYRLDDDGNEVPVYEMSDKVVIDATKLDVRTDDEDVAGKVYGFADDMLLVKGWRRTGDWDDAAGDAAYATVERA